jgi:hypothetical protein
MFKNNGKGISRSRREHRSNAAQRVRIMAGTWLFQVSLKAMLHQCGTNQKHVVGPAPGRELMHQLSKQKIDTTGDHGHSRRPAPGPRDQRKRIAARVIPAAGKNISRAIPARFPSAMPGRVGDVRDGCLPARRTSQRAVMAAGSAPAQNVGRSFHP